MNSLKALLYALVVTAYITPKCASQAYPCWFLEQDRVNCSRKEVGLARYAFRTDGSVELARQYANDIFAIHKRTTLIGDEVFWATEKGVVWLGNSFDETFDSLVSSSAKASLCLLDTFTDSSITLVLIGDSSCIGEFDRRRIDVSQMPTPEWVEQTPDDSDFVYASGASATFFYEPESWVKAEQNARLGLARYKKTSLTAVQKRLDKEGI